MSTTTATTTTPVQTQQAGVKVFVGNLSFKTNQAQLAEVFKSAGKILDANIISRGRRSMGYGFVTFENMTDAQNAVKEMHHKEIDGRQVNVEVARPKQEKPATQQNNNNNNNNNAQGGNNDNNAQGGFRSIRRNTNFRGRGGRGGFNRGPRTQGQQGQGQGQMRQNFNNNNNNNSNFNQGQNGGQRRPPRRNFRGNNNNNSNFNQGQNSGKQEQTEHQPRQPRQPKPQVEKTPSKTTLFVANLPWSVTDETFGQFLTKENIKFKKAFVARRRNGRSLGYGFVEFDTEDEQAKGITSIEKKQIDGRELTAKVALTDLSKMNIVVNNNNNNTAASTTTSATTTTTTSSAPATTTTTEKK